MMGAALTTTTSGYELLVLSAAGGETNLIAATGYTVGIPDPGTIALQPKDLMLQKGETTSNGVELICFATGADNSTATMTLYGISTGGPPEQIGLLVWTLGTAIKDTGIRWADTCVVTDTHNTTITVVDVTTDASNLVAKVTFDVTGYRYLYAIVHGSSGSTIINILQRPW